MENDAYDSEIALIVRPLRSYRNISHLYNLLMLLLKVTRGCFSSAQREEPFLLSADTSGIPVM